MRILHDFHLLDTDFETSFDRITTIGASMFKVPMCLVSLVDTDRQWFKACWGLDTRETSRDAAFCAYVIMPDAPDVMTVCDATQDPRFHNNPLVTGPPHIRFYAGTPLVCGGQKIGTFCSSDAYCDTAMSERSASGRSRRKSLETPCWWIHWNS